MGNQQSSERKPNYRIRKIISREEHSDWFRCYLDDYVPYENGEHKHMDFGKLPTAIALLGFFANAKDRRPSLHEGDYIAIDIDMTRNLQSNHDFDPSSVEKVNVSDSSSLLGEGGFQD